MRVSIFLLLTVLIMLLLGCASGLTKEEIDTIVEREVAEAIAELKEEPSVSALPIKDQNRISRLENCISALENHIHAYTPPDNSHTHGLSRSYFSDTVTVDEWPTGLRFSSESVTSAARFRAFVIC